MGCGCETTANLSQLHAMLRRVSRGTLRAGASSLTLAAPAGIGRRSARVSRLAASGQPLYARIQQGCCRFRGRIGVAGSGKAKRRFGLEPGSPDTMNADRLRHRKDRLSDELPTVPRCQEFGSASGFLQPLAASPTLSTPRSSSRVVSQLASISGTDESRRSVYG